MQFAMQTSVLSPIVTVLMTLTVVGQAPVFDIECLQSFPESMQARIELRDRQLLQLIPTKGLNGFAPQFVLTKLKEWAPGQTITVAFNGGDYSLRKDIADTATEWSNHANLKFDFGHNPAAMSFREWSPADTTFKAAIRISFGFEGYWSLVGIDSNNASIVTPGEPSMNFGGFHLSRPSSWKGTVLHEFGHALGFQHEHQHPTGGCDSEFRWYDDTGYVPTKDNFGQYVQDPSGKRPGIYTVLGGKPNEWPQWKVDHNLRQLGDSSAYEVSSFDPNSIMKYYFPVWMFQSSASHCYTPIRNDFLSTLDIAGAKAAYPSAAPALAKQAEQSQRILSGVLELEQLPKPERAAFQKQLNLLRENK